VRRRSNSAVRCDRVPRVWRTPVDVREHLLGLHWHVCGPQRAVVWRITVVEDHRQPHRSGRMPCSSFGCADTRGIWSLAPVKRHHCLGGTVGTRRRRQR